MSTIPLEDRQTDGEREGGVLEGREGMWRKKERNQKASQFRAQSSGSCGSGWSLTASTRDKNKPTSLSKKKKNLQVQQEVQQTTKSRKTTLECVAKYFPFSSVFRAPFVCIRCKMIVGGTSCETHPNLVGIARLNLWHR